LADLPEDTEVLPIDVFDAEEMLATTADLSPDEANANDLSGDVGSSELLRGAEVGAWALDVVDTTSLSVVLVQAASSLVSVVISYRGALVGVLFSASRDVVSPAPTHPLDFDVEVGRIDGNLFPTLLLFPAVAETVGCYDVDK